MMGHKTTATTERYYCTMDEQQALNKATTAYKQTPRMEIGRLSGQIPKGLASIMDEPEVPQD